MKTKPMSLANIQGKLSRAEMKQIMAGSGPYCSSDCDYKDPQTSHTTKGSCKKTDQGSCYCSSGMGVCS